jgi:hypothetical protein
VVEHLPRRSKVKGSSSVTVVGTVRVNGEKEGGGGILNSRCNGLGKHQLNVKPPKGAIYNRKSEVIWPNLK